MSEEKKITRRNFLRAAGLVGGADTRHVLNHASPAEVKDHVTRLIDIFAPGGGFVFNTVHNILPDVPPENIVAMYEAITEFNEA